MSLLTRSTALSDSKGTLDESDRFLTSPSEFVGEVFGNLSAFSHIVIFESEERHVLQLLLHNSFLEVTHRCALDITCFLFHLGLVWELHFPMEFLFFQGKIN